MKHNLEARIMRLETTMLKSVIQLEGGELWRPRISAIELLITLMETEESGAAFQPETWDEIEHWARYNQGNRGPALLGFVAMMARELVE